MKINRSLLVGFCFLLGALLIPVPSTQAGWHFIQNDYDGSFAVGPGTYYYIFAYRTAGYKELIDFEVTAGGNKDITFFICDQENFDKYAIGQTAYVYNLHEMVVSWSGEFEFPSSDTWYFIFDNMFSVITTKTVELQLNLYQWLDPPDFDFSSPSQSDVTLLVGGQTTITITLRNMGEETGQASISCTSGEDIVSTSVSPNSVSLESGDSTTVSLTINALNPGSVTLQIRVSYSGATHDVTSISVTVNTLLGPTSFGGIPVGGWIIAISGVIIAIIIVTIIFVMRKRVQVSQS